MRNILFVDDDENIIDGYKRILRRQRDRWKLHFVSTGEEALELMAQVRIDLIVTDMMMQGMRGDELLKQVTERYPATVRIIMSGHVDETALKNALSVSHQYLTKPCSPELFKELIAQVFKIQECLQHPEMIDSIGDINQLPSLPAIYHELQKEISDENSTAQSIADIFARDMVLSAKLLQLVNSPYFGFNRRISNLNEAVNLIGIKKLSHLVLSTFVTESFKVEDSKFFSYLNYVSQDSLRTGELARMIALAENQPEDRPDQAYLGGLLHNMGLLIFMSKMPDKFKLLLNRLKHSGEDVARVENEVFGFTRSEAGAYVLGLWKIPPRVTESIMLQNSPNATDYDNINALTAVHAASALLRTKLPINEECGRLFDIVLDEDYLQRIGKLDRLTHWEKLADKVVQTFANP